MAKEPEADMPYTELLGGSYRRDPKTGALKRLAATEHGSGSTWRPEPADGPPATAQPAEATPAAPAPRKEK